MTQTRAWLLYGATGYTGTRIAEEAVARGLRPVLAGRNAESLAALAQRLNLEWRAVALDDAEGLRKLLADFRVVLHAAGPFADSSAPMLRACLASGTHYLDLTGEVSVFEALAAQDQTARAAGIMLLPGVGFDMVPGDCLALYLKRLMPDAVQMDMGISFDGTMTRGTIRSALRSFSPMPRARRAHQLTALPQPLARAFDFGSGPGGGRSLAHATDFGDISVAWRSTGIADITSYLRPSKQFAALAALSSEADIAALPAGPSAEELRAHPSILVAEVANAGGQRLAARLVTPQIYAITAVLAADIAERVSAGAVRAGFQTPAILFGEDYILEFSGCARSLCAAADESAVL